MFEGYNYVEKNGQGAKDRFENPQALRAVYDHLSTEDLADVPRRTRIREQYDCHLPFDPHELEQSGQKNLANFNTGWMKGVIDQRADVITRLQADNANLIELRPIARELAGPQAAMIGRVAAEEWSTMVRDTGVFIPAIARMCKEADLYGFGPITFRSSLDYKPVALDRGQVKFIGDGPVFSSQHELIMFETELSADYLRFLLDNEELAAAEGWDVKELKDWIVRAYYENEESRAEPGTRGSVPQSESVLALARCNMLGEDEQFKTFHVINAFVKEVAWPRGITHIMMPAAADKERKGGFIFKRKNAYRTMDECFLWYPYSFKDRYIKEVRGLASFLYPIGCTNNRFTCKIVDAGFQAASTVLEQPSGGGAQDISIVEQGNYIALPPGFKAAQSQVRPDLQTLMGVQQSVDQIGARAMAGADFGPMGALGAIPFKDQSRPTKDELALQQSLRTRRDAGEFAKRQDVMNKIFRESFRRSLRLAAMNPVERVDFPEIEDWLRRCEMRGVTLEMLLSIPQLFTIVACRDLALGADGKVAALAEYVQLYGGTIDESGRRFIAREVAKLQFGQRDADEIIPERSRDQAPNDQASFATMENNQLKMGFQVMVGEDQLHWSHIPVHSRLLQEIVEMVAAPDDNTPKLNEFNGDPIQSEQIGEQTLRNIQDDPKKVLGILAACSKHVQEHLAVGGMEIGMEAQAKQVQKMLKDLRPTTKALNLAVATQERVERAQREKQEREMQALQEQASQAEIEKAKYKIDRDAEIAKYKVDKEDEIARLRLEAEGRRGDAQDAIAASRAAGDEARRNAEAQSRIDAAKKISDAKANAAQAVGRFNAVNEITGMQRVQPGDIANEPDAGLGMMSL